MKAINISICSCSKFLEHDSWKQYKNIKDVISKKIKEEFPKAKAVINEIVVPQAYREKQISFVIAKTKEEEIQVPVMIKQSKCLMCEKEGTKYFEAIIQIRSKNIDILETCIAELQEKVQHLRHRGVFINKVDRFDDGFDLYMTHNRIAQAIGRELLDRFGGELKISPRLFSKNHQTSKDIYRVNVFLQLPNFTKGDYIAYDNKTYSVESLGKKIKLSDMGSTATIYIDYAKLDYVVLKKQQTYVSKSYPHLEVINPHDFQSSMVKNKPKAAYAPGQTISVIIHRGIYVVE